MRALYFRAGKQARGMARRPMQVRSRDTLHYDCSRVFGVSGRACLFRFLI